MATTSANRSLRNKTGQITRQRKCPQRQKPFSTCSAATDGFLNQQFEPLVANLEVFGNRKQAERQFFNSMQHLSTFYGFQPLDVAEIHYPYNLFMSFQYAENQLKEKAREKELVLMKEDAIVWLATVQEATTGSTLFYLPIAPLCGKTVTNMKTTDVLKSVFAYLFQVVGIRGYWGDGYLSTPFAIIEEWMLDNPEGWDKQDYDKCLAELKRALYEGKRMQRQICHPFHLQDWQNRLSQLEVIDPLVHKIKNLATDFFKLYQQFPDSTITDHVYEGICLPEEEMRMDMGQVIAFTWSLDGWLHKQVFEIVNSEFNEMCAIDQPLSIQHFDRPQTVEQNCTEFEQTLYNLLHELTDVLISMT